MDHTVATSLVVPAVAGYYEHTQAVEVLGNAVELSLEVIAITAGTLTVLLQFGSDLENWTTAATFIQPTAIGQHWKKWENVAARYVRLALNQSSGIAVVAASLGTSSQ